MATARSPPPADQPRCPPLHCHMHPPSSWRTARYAHPDTGTRARALPPPPDPFHAAEQDSSHMYHPHSHSPHFLLSSFSDPGHSEPWQNQLLSYPHTDHPRATSSSFAIPLIAITPSTEKIDDLIDRPPQPPAPPPVLHRPLSKIRSVSILTPSDPDLPSARRRELHRNNFYSASEPGHTTSHSFQEYMHNVESHPLHPHVIPQRKPFSIRPPPPSSSHHPWSPQSMFRHSYPRHDATFPNLASGPSYIAQPPPPGAVQQHPQPQRNKLRKPPPRRNTLSASHPGPLTQALLDATAAHPPPTTAPTAPLRVPVPPCSESSTRLFQFRHVNPDHNHVGTRSTHARPPMTYASTSTSATSSSACTNTTSTSTAPTSPSPTSASTSDNAHALASSVSAQCGHTFFHSHQQQQPLHHTHVHGGCDCEHASSTQSAFAFASFPINTFAPAPATTAPATRNLPRKLTKRRPQLSAPAAFPAVVENSTNAEERAGWPEKGARKRSISVLGLRIGSRKVKSEDGHNDMNGLLHQNSHFPLASPTSAGRASAHGDIDDQCNISRRASAPPKSFSTTIRNADDSAERSTEIHVKEKRRLSWVKDEGGMSGPPVPAKKEWALDSDRVRERAGEESQVTPRRWTLAMADVSDEVLVLELERMRVEGRRKVRTSTRRASGRGREEAGRREWERDSGCGFVYGGPSVEGTIAEGGGERRRTRKAGRFHLGDGSDSGEDEGEGEEASGSYEGGDDDIAPSTESLENFWIDDDEGWKTARKALLCCRELVRTERSYAARLRQLLTGDVLDAWCAPRVAAIVHAYVPALLGASEALLARLEDDPSAWGVGTAFVECEDELETALVAWCGVVGEIFVDTGEDKHARKWATRKRAGGEGLPRRTRAETMVGSTRSRSWLSMSVGMLAQTQTQTQTQAGEDASSRPRAASTYFDHRDGGAGNGNGNVTGMFTAALSNGLPSGLQRESDQSGSSSPGGALGRSRSSRLSMDSGAFGKTLAVWRRRSVFSSSASLSPVAQVREKECKPTMRELAIQPTQRIMRYVLLYRDLVQHTPASSPSRGLVERALEGCVRIAQKCDRAQDNSAFLRRP